MVDNTQSLDHGCPNCSLFQLQGKSKLLQSQCGLGNLGFEYKIFLAPSSSALNSKAAECNIIPNFGTTRRKRSTTTTWSSWSSTTWTTWTSTSGTSGGSTGGTTSGSTGGATSGQTVGSAGGSSASSLAVTNTPISYAHSDCWKSTYGS